MELVGTVEAAWRASGKKRIAVSRASWLREHLWIEGAIQVPVMSGRSVWSVLAKPDETFVVVEQPNFFGRIECAPNGGADLTIRWWKSVEQVAGPMIAADRQSGDLDAATRLATAFRTVPGVKLPHGTPLAPWFILSLRCCPVAVSRALAAAGWQGATPLGTAFPEFPGGLHLEVAWPRQDNREVAAVVRAALEDAEND
jgi:hypothetical protein